MDATGASRSCGSTRSRDSGSGIPVPKRFSFESSRSFLSEGHLPEKVAGMLVAWHWLHYWFFEGTENEKAGGRRSTHSSVQRHHDSTEPYVRCGRLALVAGEPG
ncbi:unnamed protein product [Symbiodinium sp. CCMP2592]|nr:unnamed protein product [Symbiodinium sp. CCMP2592]